jgi:molybdopterin synthase sulfur carrier subunit
VKVDVRYFASVREALGARESIDVASGSDVGAVRDALIAKGGAHAEVLARGRALRIAVDQVLCDETAPVEDGSELAFFPPVTGG